LQDAVVAFLSDPANHGGQVPEQKATHGALVFLLPDRVYKMKRDVRYSFMDFSTPEKRRAVCEEEIRLNTQTSEGLYLGTRPILPGNPLRWGEIGSHPEDAVETVVVMKRFDSTLADVPPNRDELKRLAETVARFHRAALPIEDAEESSAIDRVQQGNLDTIAAEPACDPDRVAVLRERCLDMLDRSSGLLDRRAAAGSVRHCHGDLHLGNVCRWQGAPTLFDCIDFNPDFARIDILYDLAFLLMDIDRRMGRADSNLVLNRYLESMPAEVSGLSLLPLFLSMRAQVSAKVKFAAAHFEIAERAADRRRVANDFLDLAIRYLSPKKPVLLAIGGASGSGKSSLARAVAPEVGAAPGAVIARSDAVRKRLFGAAHEAEKLPATAYTKAAHQATYEEMETVCTRALEQGQSAIADATFTHAGSRADIEAVARRCNVPFLGIWLDLDKAEAARRVHRRTGDVSDATPDVVHRQFEEDWGQIAWHRIDAQLPPDKRAERASALIDQAEMAP